MKGISDRMAEAIVQRSEREEEYIEVISYGLQVILGTIAEFISIIIIGFLLGLFKEMLVASTIFAAMRMVAGGVHFSTYLRCFSSSVLMFTLAGYTASFFYTSPLNIGIVYLLSSACFIVYCLYKYSPRDNPNRLIKEEELPKFRRLSFLFAGIIFVILLVIFYINGSIGWYHYSIVTGLLLEGFSLTDTGYSFIKYIENRLEKRGGVHNEKS